MKRLRGQGKKLLSFAEAWCVSEEGRKRGWSGQLGQTMKDPE